MYDALVVGFFPGERAIVAEAAARALTIAAGVVIL
jgi:hypothetical protein